MVQGNLKSQEGSLLNQNIQGYPEQRNPMHYNGQGWTNFESHVQGVIWQNQMEQRAFSHLFNATTKISTSITKSWSEVTPPNYILTYRTVQQFQHTLVKAVFVDHPRNHTLLHRLLPTHQSQSLTLELLVLVRTLWNTYADTLVMSNLFSV